MPIKVIIYGAIKISLKLLLVIISSALLIWLSVFIYASVYYNFIPTVSHARAVNFEFNPKCDTELMNSNNHIDDNIFPSANVILQKSGYSPLLMSGQPYRINLELEMPESRSNIDIGMFTVDVNFVDKQKRIVFKSTRSAMIRYSSPLLKYFKTILLSSLFISGISEEKQVLNIIMNDEFVDDPNYPSYSLKVVIKSCKIQIYSSTITFDAQFRGLRYFMYYWPLISAFFGIGMGQFLIFSVAFLSWYRFLWPNQKKIIMESLPRRQTQNKKEPEPPKKAADNPKRKFILESSFVSSSTTSNDAAKEEKLRL